MFWLFKCIGMILILVVSVIIGFGLSAKEIQKYEKLRFVCRGINSLAERLRISNASAKKLLKLSFPDEVLSWKAEEYFINEKDFLSEDLCLFKEFLKDFGKGDAKSEYNRAIGYANLFECRYKELKEKSGTLCGLYRKLGFLVGLFICVFLM